MARKVFVFHDENGMEHIGSRGWTLFKNLETYVFGEGKQLHMSYHHPTENSKITEKCTHATIQALLKEFDKSESYFHINAWEGPIDIDDFTNAVKYISVSEINIE